MKNMKIGVIGGGVVGKATARSYLEHVAEVRVYDIRPERSTHSFQQVMKCDLIFLCLPTPQKGESGECDVSYVEKELADCASWDKNLNLVLRSTVPIGTTKRLAEKYGLTSLVHSPEFLTARCADTDAQMPARNIIGCPYPPEGLQGGSFWPHCVNALDSLYRGRFPHVHLRIMSSDESEAVKLFQNAFFAVKVAFWNEMHVFAERLGLNWKTVLNAILRDGRISPSHTQVPGPDGYFGFGGECLPKDLASLVYQMQLSGDKWEGFPYVCNNALQRNKLDRARIQPQARKGEELK